MSSRTDRTRALALTLAALLVAVAFGGLAVVRPASAASVQSGASGTISVTATTTFTFAPNEFQNVPANANVTVDFTDASATAHTFTIIGKEGWVIPASITPTDFNNLVYGHSPVVVFNFNISSAGTQPESFTSPPPGWYEFVCTEPGHFALGMYGFIAFGMNLPANLTVASSSEAPGAALFIIIGTIVTLVVIALVLGFVVGKREGSKHEMPPERLGYPEPPATGHPLPPSTNEGDHR